MGGAVAPLLRENRRFNQTFTVPEPYNVIFSFLGGLYIKNMKSTKVTITITKGKQSQWIKAWTKECRHQNANKKGHAIP